MSSFTDFSFSIRDKQIGVLLFLDTPYRKAFHCLSFLSFLHPLSLPSWQTESIERMLHLHASTPQANGEYWKVVVFDDYCCDVLALLLRKGEFRNNGVTLTLYPVTTTYSALKPIHCLPLFNTFLKVLLLKTYSASFFLLFGYTWNCLSFSHTQRASS